MYNRNGLFIVHLAHNLVYSAADFMRCIVARCFSLRRMMGARESRFSCDWP